MLTQLVPVPLRQIALPASPHPVLNVAHRGASARAPENTLAALSAAIADGADLVEFDVRRTRDGALVLMHDATLDRTTNARSVFPGRGPWSVADFTLDELARLDARAPGGPYAGERVATLDEALTLVRPTGVGTLVEVKAAPDGELPVAEVAAELSRRGSHRTTVQSFDIAGMRALRELMPTVQIAVLGNVARGDLRELSRWADQVHPHHRRVDRRLVDEAHGWGMRCMVWTVNGPAWMRHAISMRVDGVITDHPARFRQVASAA